jgi:hypothetical protein
MTDDDPETKKNTNKYNCKKCYFITCKKTDYTRHLETQKHKNNKNDDLLMTDDDFKNEKNEKNEKIYYCQCGKKYKYKQGIHVHRKKCNFKNSLTDINENNQETALTTTIKEESDISYKTMFLDMMKQNKELQNTICEMIPKMGNTVNTTNNTNNTNNINNINVTVFLNDKCKDAISMTDFIKTIDISLDDLYVTKNKGLIGGISNIFVNQLNKLPLVQRPIWCSDKKRKRLFIKEDTWTEDTDNIKTAQAIKSVSVLQTKNINKYTKEKPNWIKNDKEKDDYIYIVKTTTDTVEDKTNPIIDKMIDVIHLTTDKREKLSNK